MGGRVSEQTVKEILISRMGGGLSVGEVAAIWADLAQVDLRTALRELLK